MAKVLRINNEDNVVIAAEEIKKGTIINDGNQDIEVLEDIPVGHKIATQDIPKGENVIRYGNPIGHTTEEIKIGSWAHVHNIKTNLSDLVEYQYNPVADKQVIITENVPTFKGYKRKDGSVGIRNEIWIIPTVFCANGPAQKIAEEANRKYGRTANFDGFYALTHANGCSQVGEDLMYTQKIIANLIQHSNAGAVLLVSLGCEVNNFESMKPYLGSIDMDRVMMLNCQEVEDEIEVGLEYIDKLYEYASKFNREEVPVSDLVMAVNCGGSDAFSGISANALLGKVTDKITSYGGTVVMTEVPEMFGAEHILMNRAKDENVFEDIVKLINDYKLYFKKYGQEIYENPTQGNKEGGISTLEEKSLGCIQKGGQSIVTDVLAYGDKVKTKGFNLISGPGNDLVGITNQEAAGCVLTVFTTGRGTPTGFTTPLIRLGSNSNMSKRKHDWIDYNAGDILDGNKDFEQATEELFAMILKVASGEMQSKAEAKGYRQIGMLRDGITN